MRLFGPTSLALGALLAGALVMPSSAPVSADDNDNNNHHRNFRASLKSFNEVPALSTEGQGTFKARLSQDGTSLKYTLTFSGLSSPVTQSHIHFAKSRTNGAIMVWLCHGPANVDPAGLAPACPDEGTVEGTITAANILTAGTQGIAAGEFEEFLRALREDAGYANVHTNMFPGGEIRGQVED